VCALGYLQQKPHKRQNWTNAISPLLTHLFKTPHTTYNTTQHS